MSDHSPYKVLLADEDRGVREGLAGMLRSAGFEVSTAEHGMDAMFLLHQTLPDVVIYETSIPRMSGCDFLGMVRFQYPETLVIAVDSAADSERATDMFADAVYVKDRKRPEALLETVNTLIQRTRTRPAPN